MNSEMKSLLQNDLTAFSRKAIYEFDRTIVSDDRYIEYLTTQLKKIAEGKIKRILMNVPPRHLKTKLASVSLSAWILAHKPTTKILVVTYSEELARNIARDIRTILRTEWYREAFATRIAKGHASVMDFATTAGGAVHAASLHGSITGFGADVIIADDIHNVKDAGRPKILRADIDQFHAAVMSRRNSPKHGRVIVIGHRIHEQDLSASLLDDGGWTHVLLPLIATHDQIYQTAHGPWRRRKGEVLRHGEHDEREIETMRTKLVNPSFELYYQQDVDGQALPPIKAEHFPSYRPDSLRDLPHVISVDAGTASGDGKSFSVVQAWAYDEHNRYLVDQYRERCDFHELGRMTRRLAKRHRWCPVIIEAAANGPALLSELTRKQQRRVVGIVPRGSKAARLRPHLEKIVAGRVQLPRDADFRAAFIQELVEFPSGRHTDQVDAFSQALTWIDENGQVEANGSGNSSNMIAVATNSQFVGFQHQPKPNAPGIMAVSTYSSRAPNAPFPKVKAWVKY